MAAARSWARRCTPRSAAAGAPGRKPVAAAGRWCRPEGHRPVQPREVAKTARDDNVVDAEVKRSPKGRPCATEPRWRSRRAGALRGAGGAALPVQTGF